MLLANFNGKEHLRHRAVSLRQHGFLVYRSDHDLLTRQESPAVAGKPARRESMPKLLQFDVLTALQHCHWQYWSIVIRFCCIRNLRNPKKFSENSRPWDINVTYTPLKSTFCGLQFCHLAAVASQIKMRQNSDKIWPYSISRSSKVIDLGVNRKPICDFLLVINCIAVSATVFEIFTLKDRKLPILPTPTLFEAPLRGTP